MCFVILHADLDSFYASVEQRDEPRLRGRPVLVGGGVVLAASYEAKALGVLEPAPARRLWGVGRITAGKLHERGVFTVGVVAQLEPRALVAMLGPASGHHLYALAHNHDPRPVVTRLRPRSICGQRALGI